VKKIEAAIKKTEELNEIGRAMVDSKSFANTMSSAYKNLTDSCQRLNITTQTFKVFKSSTNQPILIKSSTVLTDDDLDFETL
jgi:hypothetical protein